MKILTLTVNEFRGFRHRQFDFRGQTAAFLGPNGSGKSSLVDAIDFLMSGTIRRLEGEGAGDLSIAKHGPHLDAKAEDAWVEAEMEYAADKNPLVLRRCLAEPNVLISAQDLPESIRNAFLLAQQGGHHLLTRRELLRFVFTEPGNRAKAVASLLQLESIEEARKDLQGAAKLASDRSIRGEAAVAAYQTAVLRSFVPPCANAEDLLARINRLRKMLRGDELSSFDGTSMAAGLEQPAAAAAHPLQSQKVRSDIGALVANGFDTLRVLAADAESYLRRFRAFRLDDRLQASLRAGDLVSKGLALLEGDQCPLCLSSVPRSQLQDLFDRRRERAAAAGAERLAVKIARQQLLRDFEHHRLTLKDLVSQLSTHSELPSQRLQELEHTISDGAALLLVDEVEGAVPEADFLRSLPTTVLEAETEVRSLEAQAQALPELSKLQEAWDQISQASKSVKNLDQARIEVNVERRVSDALRRASSHFITARDSILQDTYDAVADRMGDLYRQIHASDESNFGAYMAPTRAGLKLSVEFRNKGQFPPSALHSEGHQDSMGLCFFLALTEYLAGADLPVVVLDDVVMSVDYNHRRGVAQVLAKEVGGRQLIITTHDRVWWRQLRTLGVVSRANSFEFTGWSLEEGPREVEHAGDPLSRARIALEKGDAPQAAAALRRAVEEVFPDICDALGARVRYRADGANEAGEFVQAAISTYGDLLRKAKDASQQWKRDATALNELDQKRATVCKDFAGEAWLVNPSLHFNLWSANISAADFTPVMRAYDALFRLFTCGQCGGLLHAIEVDHTLSVVKCACGEVTWHCQLPPKT
jgi:recombinational DNA repair ATPase RecF